jgi:serine/threonine-protein kinase
MADLLERLSAALRDRYRAERELGRGGMGIVVQAHDLKHDRSVAIKVLRPEIAAPVQAGRFLREIHIAAQLQHPNILQLLDSGDVDGLAYYVMPFVLGESLRERLDREKQLPIDEALHITAEVADALSYAHEHGVIHRDIKPENIMLSSGHALVMDFGIARALSEAAGDRITETGIAVGTPAYMSPEQASGTGDIDHRTDIYSLASVLYEMLAGSPPYVGTTPMAIIAKKALEPVPGLRVVRDTVPQHVEDAIVKALAKVPADRFTNAREFASALTGARTFKVVPLMKGPGASRRRWMLAGAAGAVVLLSGIYVLAAGVPFTAHVASPTNLRFSQLTSAPGVEWFPSLTADGKWIVYAGQQSGNRDIYLQSVGGQMAINLTKDSPADDDQPAFSPDGERIAFRSSRDGGGIFVMGRTGEGVRRVTTMGFHPTWSADGTQIAFTNENVEMNPGNSEGASGLWIVSASGGEPRKLPSGDAIQPSWSPHGYRIAFGRRLGVAALGDISTIAPNGEAPVRLTNDAPRDWSPVWSPDGRYVYYSSDRGGSMNLWRIAVDERSGNPRGPPEPVTTPATFLAHPSVAAGGRLIAYASAQVSINIERIAFDPVSRAVVGRPSAVTTGSRQWSSPDPSPDGEWVAFYSVTQPEGDLYLSRPDGSEFRQLTSDTAIDRVPRWSPDGKWIAFFSNRAVRLHLWKVRPDGSGLQRLTAFTAAYEAWSPDAQRMATSMGNAIPGDSLVMIDPARGADEQHIVSVAKSSLGKFLPNSWSADGKHLVGQYNALGSGGKGIVMYSFPTNTFEQLADFGEWPVWLPDSRHVLFVANRNAFYVVDSRTKEVRKVFAVERDVIGPPRLTRDGRTAYFSRRVTEADIWLLSMP